MNIKFPKDGGIGFGKLRCQISGLHGDDEGNLSRYRNLAANQPQGYRTNSGSALPGPQVSEGLVELVYHDQGPS